MTTTNERTTPMRRATDHPSSTETQKIRWMSPFAFGGSRRSDLLIDLAPLFGSADLPELMRALDE